MSSSQRSEARLVWYRVLDHAELQEGRVKPVTCARQTVCMTHYKGQYAALDNRCPHQGGPLGMGELDETADACYVTCPWHGWQFDIRTGAHRTSPLQHVTLPVKIEDGAVFVDLES